MSQQLLTRSISQNLLSLLEVGFELARDLSELEG